MSHHVPLGQFGGMWFRLSPQMVSLGEWQTGYGLLLNIDSATRLVSTWTLITPETLPIIRQKFELTGL